MSGALLKAFEERLDEVNAYLNFLDEVEKATTSGAPRFEGSGVKISVQQTRILYSSLYLQLYNLVESTITSCLDELTNAALKPSRWIPGDMIAEMRREWVRVMVGSHKDLNYENRLKQAVQMAEYLLDALPLQPFKLEKGGGGNWDDKSIEEVAKRIGLALKISRKTKREVKETFRDDRGALGVVVHLRNGLAHGSLSFVECGENDDVDQLRQLTQRTANYMSEVVSAFENFIDGQEFIVPPKRLLGI